jgi:hypothetical protein
VSDDVGSPSFQVKRRSIEIGGVCDRRLIPFVSVCVINCAVELGLGLGLVVFHSAARWSLGKQTGVAEREGRSRWHVHSEEATLVSTIHTI